jgi:hypothetical protein
MYIIILTYSMACHRIGGCRIEVLCLGMKIYFVYVRKRRWSSKFSESSPSVTHPSTSVGTIFG